METKLYRNKRFQKNLNNCRDFFSLRSKQPDISPSVLLRRKSAVRSGAIIGSALGMIVFFFLAILVTMGIIPLPGLAEAASNEYLTLTMFLGILFGLIFGAACGALVGIGTPIPLDNPDGDLEK